MARKKTPAEKPLTDAERTRLENDAQRAAIIQNAERLVLDRTEIIDDLEGFRQVSMLDFLEQTAHGRIKLKSLDEMNAMSRHHRRWIKKVRIQDTIDGQVTTIEGVDVMRVIEKAGEHLKLWDSPAQTTNILLIQQKVQRLMNMTPDQLADYRLACEQRLRVIQAEPRPP